MPANSVATKETAAAQTGSGRSRIEYFAFNLAISFQSPLRLTLQRVFATKFANFVEEDLKIWCVWKKVQDKGQGAPCREKFWCVCLDSLFFLGATLASKSRRNFVTWDDRDRSFRHRAPQSCSSVAFSSRLQRRSLQEKVLDAEWCFGRGHLQCVVRKIKNSIAGMLDVGKDIVSHFKHSDLSTNALLEQQREMNPTIKPRKLIQTSWKDKHQQMYWVSVVFWSRTSPLLQQPNLRDLEVLSMTPSALGLIWRGSGRLV